MRCLTCSKRINPQMKECPNCGAMVPQPERPAGKPAPSQPASSPSKSSGKEFDWKSVLTPREPAGAPQIGRAHV